MHERDLGAEGRDCLRIRQAAGRRDARLGGGAGELAGQPAAPGSGMTGTSPPSRAAKLPNVTR